MAEKPLRKNELGVIALLSGMIRQYKETNTLDDVHNLICKTSDEILDICEGETPKQTESNFSIPVVVFSEERAKVCKRDECWKECVTWINDCRCIKDCDLHKQT